MSRNEFGWPTGPESLSLGADVHVWKARVDVAGPLLERLASMLAPDELERADKFRFPEYRTRFVAARGIRRDILARYTGHPAGELRFSVEAHGKPHLIDSPLRFNMSHSGVLALYAIALDREVGVDIETIASTRANDAVADRFFSQVEREELARLAGADRETAFFRCWTRKEAYVKAIGTGLRTSLDSFSVPVGEMEGVFEVDGVCLRNLDAGAGYASALAVQGATARCMCWEWIPSRPSSHAPIAP